MKKAIKVLLAILLVSVMVAVVAACTPTEADPCAKGHTWDAGQKVTTDCTQPGKLVQRCKVCGATQETDLPAGDHTWGEFEQTKAPTCTEPGTQVATCTVCGKTEEQPVEATGHVWSEFEQTKAPTCTEPGTQTRKCTVCGETEEQPVEATGHIWGEITPSKQPTCKEPGVASAKCTVCGETTDSYEIPATGLHSWNDGVVTVEPTCDAEGVRTYTCSVCGDTTTQALPATGHVYGRLNPQVDATCTEPGTRAYYQCSVCGKLFNSSKNEVQSSDLVIRALGHNPVRQEGKPASCTEEGIEAYYKCGRCGKLFEDQSASKPLDRPKTIPTTDHTPQPYGAKDATCTEQGATAGSKCAVCGKILTTPKATPALGHQLYYVEHEELETHTERCRRCDHNVEQPCTPGTVWSYNDDYHWHTCLLCGGAVDHEAHTTVPGSKICNVCGHEIGEVIVRVSGEDDKLFASIAAAVNYISETYADGAVQATVIVNANRGGDGIEIGGKVNLVIDLAGFEYQISKGTTSVTGEAVVEFRNGTIQGDLTYNGGTLKLTGIKNDVSIVLSRGYNCDNAKIYIDGTLRQHKYPETWTRKDDALHARECEYCGNEVTQSHEWGQGIVTQEPTCTDKGVKTFTCECGATKTEDVAAKGHSYPSTWEHLSTDKFGEHSHKCERCNTRETASCTITENVCSVCEYPYQPEEILKALFDINTEEEKLPGTYKLSGVITAIVEGYNSKFENITVDIQIGEYTLRCYRLEGTGVDKLVLGDEITVKGTLIYTHSIHEFNESCELVSVNKPDYEIKLEVVKPEGVQDAVADVRLSASTAKPGEEVTVTVDITNYKYRVDKVTANGISVSAQADGTYKFVVERETEVVVTFIDKLAPVEGVAARLSFEEEARKNDKFVSGYESSFTATRNGVSWTITNINNNTQSEQWDHIRAGRKNGVTSEGYISAQIAGKITRVAIKIGYPTSCAISTANKQVDKFVLYVGGGLSEDGKSVTDLKATIDIKALLVDEAKEYVLDIPSNAQGENLYYLFYIKTIGTQSKQGYIGIYYIDYYGLVEAVCDHKVPEGELIHHEGKPESCTEDGYKEMWECPICRKYFNDKACTDENVEKKAVVIPATGHSGTKQDGKPATCAEEGYSDYWYCSKCGKYALSDELDAYIYDSDAAVKAAGKIDKLTTHPVEDVPFEEHEGGHAKLCPVCKQYVEQADHDEGKWVSTDEKLHWKECTVCGAVVTEKTSHDFGEADAEKCECGRTAPHIHQFETVSRIEPKCEQPGLTEHVKCTRCNLHFDSEQSANNGGKAYNESEAAEHYAIQALGHNYQYEGAMKEPIAESNEHGIKCERFEECGTYGEREEHTWNTENLVNKEEQGHEQTCTECSAKEVVDHNFEYERISLAEGFDPLNHTAKCACGYTVQQQHKFGDNYNDDCACGEVRVSEVTMKINREYMNNLNTGGLNSNWANGTGTKVDENGVTIKWENLSANVKNDEFGMQAAKNDKGLIYNDTEMPGRIIKIIITFSDVTNKENIALTVGTTKKPITAATPTQQSNTLVYIWTASDTQNFTFFQIKSTGTGGAYPHIKSIEIVYSGCTHTWVNDGEGTAPDCKTQQNGIQPVKCIRCGATETQTIQYTHDLVEIPENPATCEHPGNIHHYKCNDCEKLFYTKEGVTEITDGKEVTPQMKHSFEQNDLKTWTYDRTGHWYYCTQCEKKYNEEGSVITSAIEHEDGYTSNSTQHWKKCEICGWEDTENKSNHSYTEAGGKCICGATEDPVSITIDGSEQHVADLEKAFQAITDGAQNVTITVSEGLISGNGITYDGKANTNVTVEFKSTYTVSGSFSFSGSATVKLIGSLKADLVLTGGTLDLSQATVTGSVTMTVEGSTAMLVVGTTESNFTDITIDVSKGSAADAKATFTNEQSVYNGILHLKGAICTDFTEVKFNSKPISHTYSEYIEDGEEGHMAECDICQDVLTDEHHYVYDATGPTDAETHSVKCEECGYQSKEEHFDLDPVDEKCDKCNAEIKNGPVLLATFDMGTAKGSAAAGDSFNKNKLGGWVDENTIKSTNGSYTLKFTSKTQVYYGAYIDSDVGIRLGSKSNTGNIKFTVPSEVVKIVISAARYSSDSGNMDVTIGSKTTATLTTSFKDYTFEIGSTKDITIASSSKRILINTIEFWG